ncbi:hypothetical protein [Oryzicola mucosus]|uniref:PE cleavage protein A C-terminal domain-containing protein n=1 Tax=Oryzicola mucosus TaxID=2767425 RepID=A0A8J6TYQ0_9HYPH|nr:hypothetical protein [Oryzicola mucosus]MBD0415149.1 hypothetical protein [Oryzicola mucosus]
MSRLSHKLLGAGAVLLCTFPAMADPDYSGFEKETLLRFHNAPEAGAPIRFSPTLEMSFGGEPTRAIMDTGSTGIVVSADVIPDVQNLKSTGTGTLTYSSSGRIMHGNWVVTPVTITGSNGESVTTTPLPVLAVNRIDCFSNARDCEPTDNPTRVAMMGIGFGRESDHQGQSTPDKNPFLNVADMGTAGGPGSMSRGYIVTRESIYLGLTGGNTRGFEFVQLTQNSTTNDWSGVAACISLGGGEPACGTALVDTGVTVMYLTLPTDREKGNTQDGENGAKTLVPETELSVIFGATPSAEAPGYAFSVGDTDQPAAPERIVLVGGENRPTFVNTSVHALNAFDYLYDADNGYVGFRKISE